VPNEERMTLNEGRKYLRLIKKRYLKARKLGRGRLLDEMQAIAALHRKSLIRLMSGTLERKARHKQRGCCRLPTPRGALFDKLWMLRLQCGARQKVTSPRGEESDIRIRSVTNVLGRQLDLWGFGRPFGLWRVEAQAAVTRRGE